MRSRSTLPVIGVILGAAVAACSAPSVLVKRPTDRPGDAAVTALWADEIRRVAEPGDWILSRSYSFTGDLIVLGTGGEDLTHASIYDAERAVVIEAVPPVVREIPLEKFLHRNHHVLLVRPHRSPEQRRGAIARARTKLGVRFDYSGLFGLEDPARFYCSELVAWASGAPATNGVLAPSDLFAYGQVVYVSGARTSPQLQALALDRGLHRRAVARAK
jgi:hypothetical protein